MVLYRTFADNTVASVVGPDGVPEGYGYGAAGQRATRSRNLGQAGGFTTAYLGGLYEEDTPSGDKRLLYVFNGRVVARRTIPAGGGGGTVAYLHGDALGSVAATTNGAGAYTASQRHAPFGAVRAGGGLPTTLGFTGQRQDAQTGLAYYNARYYDPAIARFVSADVAPPAKEEPQSRNRYSYVLNNPLKYTDPTGHCYAGPTDNRPDLQEENAACDMYISWLKGWGVAVAGYGQWMSWELRVVWGAVARFGERVLNDSSGAIFKDKLGGLTIQRVVGNAVPGAGACAQPTTFQCSYGNTIYFTDATFAGGEKDWRNTQRTTLHELAHRLDARGGELLSQLMARYTGAGTRVNCGAGENCWNPGDPRVPTAPTNVREDFAEAVAWFAMWEQVGPDMDRPLNPLFGPAPGQPGGSTRYRFARCAGQSQGDFAGTAQCMRE